MKSTLEIVPFEPSRFFVDGVDENGDETKRMVCLRRAMVIVSVPFKNGNVEKVAFSKTNRGENYRDSRGKKVETKDAWGNKVVKMRPLMITGAECRSELSRMLDDESLAADAWRALQV